VAFASPVSQPPRRLHSARMLGPPARWMAPSTPPPHSSGVLVEFTIASTFCAVRSPITNVVRMQPLYHPAAAADRRRVNTAPPAVPYRRMGSILVERGLISEAQLGQALAEQDSSGRLLGEILVSSF